MGLTSLSTQIGVICGSFLFLVAFHWYLLYHCKSKWITSIPCKSICLLNASIFAFVCGFGGLYIWLNPSDEQLIHPLHGTNLFQEYICLIGVGYFIYDILIVIFIDPTIPYLIHAILGMIFGYLGGVIPLASHSGSFVMAYEISTPFKNARYLMIKWGYSKSMLFRLVEILFIVSFIYIRLIIGLPAMYNVTHLFLNEIQIQQQQKTNNYNIFALYSTYFLLYGGWANVLLNAYWSYAIFKAIIVFSKHKGDYTPNDENEIVYDNQEHCFCGDMELVENSNINISISSSLITEGDKLYFGRLYFRNAPGIKQQLLTCTPKKPEIHIDVYQHNMSTTYYKCDIAALFMSLNHTFKAKQWCKYLLSWDRNSHFGDTSKSLMYSVKKLLYFYSSNPLIKDSKNSDYHRAALKKVKYGNIYLLTLLKTFGIGWNPISVYYCFDETNTNLLCILFEMINVPWSKRHVYVLPIQQFAIYNDEEKQWIIEFMKICPFSPMDFTYFNGKPNGYKITANNPLNSAQNNGILQIHGHVFSFLNYTQHKDKDKNIIYHHKWGTSSCIIPIIPNNNNNKASPVIEFGLHKCIESELNSYNLLYLLMWYPFSSFVLRFQLYLFCVVNWFQSQNNKKYSNKPCHSMHFKKRLSYFELTAELFKICIGAFCFLFITIWNIIEQCRHTMERKQSNS